LGAVSSDRQLALTDRLSRWVRHLAVRAIAVAAIVAAAAGGLRALGAFESVELLIYDVMLSRLPEDRRGSERVALIGATEDDLNRFGWPLSDAILAEAVDRLAALGPSAIAIDLYRDLPRPPGVELLEASLGRHDNVYSVFKFADGENSGIPPPAAHRGTERTGFADTIADAGGIVRRGLLFLDDGTTASVGISLRLALHFLTDRGIGLAPSAENPEHLRLGRTVLPPFHSDDGGYVGTDARGYQILLDYRAGARPFATMSLAELLDGRIDPEVLRDRVVILGVAAESVKDYFFIPHSRGLGSAGSIYGIDLHGHEVSQLLRHALDDVPATRTIGPGLQSAWIGFWSLLGSLLALRVRAIAHILLGTSGGLAMLAAIGFATLSQWLWLPIVPAGVAGLASVLTTGSLILKQQRMEREALMNIFARNVSPAIAENLWRERQSFMDGGRPRARNLVATVLFTDLKGFSKISETLSAEELMSWLNEYMETMANAVQDSGGVVDKFIGDAIMAVFGIPVPREDDSAVAEDAERAVRCALAMRLALERLNAAWSAQGRATVGMRIGIHTGELVAGGLGSAKRMNYTVIGDTVNTAARLESFDKTVGTDQPCRILISDATYERVQRQFAVGSVGTVNLPGKDRPIAVFMVRGLRHGDEV
jgi:adenylate cyclase